MSNSSKPIKFSHIQKLANQSTLNGAHVTEITKTCKVALMNARNSLIFQCGEKRVNREKTENGKVYF